MVINLEQKKIHFDLRFILTYNKYICKIIYKGEKELKTDLQYTKFMERLILVHTFVAEDLTLQCYTVYLICQ